MAGLYGDLPQAKNAASDAPAWGGVPKLQPQFKKQAILAPPPSVLRAAGRGGGRTAVGGRGAGRGVKTEVKTETDTDPNNAAGVQAPVSIFLSIQDEYDPMKPNDYEEVLKERERIKREAEAEAERQARLKEMEAAMEKLRQQEQANAPGDPYSYRPRAGSGFSSGTTDNQGPGETATAGLGAPSGNMGDKSDKGMTLAQKMLMKMGWKEGEGLGRERQGISTPLVMQKTNARAGVIVNAEPINLPGPPPLPGDKRPRSGAQIVGNPSRVLCLRNMVGPGEVDEELEDEVGQECTKYGTVTSVMIFEVTQQGYPPEEAVRIFIQFDRQECAMKALVDLQGRFFGGREVRAAFFSEERFARTELAPVPGEFS